MNAPREQRQQWAEDAKTQLTQAQRTRQNYDDLLRAAIAEHGDVVGTPTSGVYNPAFPDSIKDELRTLAHNIGEQVANAYVLWRMAGKRRYTLQPFAEDARKLKDGRISYY